ncbi:hypothetical protein [Stratiformator vulcanicus]|uniref:Uncharacterized protein n=1 Tax=Stratiformator vulcanicus TaxID=2527980 RepID=A0A517R346_9PLAN|nr:hypothetical protein [Stratiformator vulcanicus]QDT38284.1 hypothetical protein Pan189_26740 [Stratiformator vulcanicus]
MTGLTITAAEDSGDSWTARADIEPAIVAVASTPDRAFSRLIELLEIDFSQRPVLRSTSVAPHRVVWRFGGAIRTKRRSVATT